MKPIEKYIYRFIEISICYILHKPEAWQLTRPSFTH